MIKMLQVCALTIQCVNSILRCTMLTVLGSVVAVWLMTKTVSTPSDDHDGYPIRPRTAEATLDSCVLYCSITIKGKSQKGCMFHLLWVTFLG